MIATITDCAPSMGAVTTRSPFDSVCFVNADIEAILPAPGALTRQAIAVQPDWLRGVPTDRRFPEGARLLFTGCGTSFHAAQTGGDAVQALELVLRPERDADVLVAVSHEGDTPLTVEAVRAWPGEKWLVTGNPNGSLVALSHEVVVATPGIETSWCHTASYTCAVATLW